MAGRSPNVGIVTSQRRAQAAVDEARAHGLEADARVYITGLLRIQATKLLSNLRHEVLETLSDEMRTAMDTFARNAGSRAERIAIHQSVAATGQQAVLEAYDDMVVSEEGPASSTHYRSGASGAYRRFAAGVLRRALADEAFYDATYDGIAFINTNLLDQEAKQWYRLAFGAGGEGGEGTHSSFEVRFGDLNAGALGIEAEASAPFEMPPGMFLDEEMQPVPFAAAHGEHEFAPLGYLRRIGYFANQSHQRRPSLASRRWIFTHGIRGRDYFSPGLAAMAKLLPLAYEDYGRTLVERSFQPHNVKKTVKG